ncbi:MAG: HK97 family phage prohead protease [Prolixibacteraceae bacterium]
MEKLIVRSNEGDNSTYIDGYASVFNQRSRLIFEDGKKFYEIIKEGAFDEVLRSESLNVKAVINHDDSKLLGRSKSGTLTLEVDNTGLKYSIRMGKTQLHRDTVEMVERGDLAESSFKYKIGKGDSVFQRDSNGDLLHIVSTVRGLYDISLVNDGAFTNTNVIVRSALNDFEQAEKEEHLRQIKEENAVKRNYLKELKNNI